MENPMQLNTKSTKKRKRQSTDLSITDSIPFPSGFPETPVQKRTEAKETFESYRELILENIDYDVLAGDPCVDREPVSLLPRPYSGLLGVALKVNVVRCGAVLPPSVTTLPIGI